jgi:CheY-like chemotaxis protein
VLVADDEPSVRLLLRVNLSMSGFEVVEAADGEEALARARDGRFDLFVLDVMMPGLSGLEVAARLRSEAETSGVPFVFISARADEADVQEGYAVGRRTTSRSRSIRFGSASGFVPSSTGLTAGRRVARGEQRDASAGSGLSRRRR